MNSEKELSKQTNLVHEISRSLDESEWFLKLRLNALSLLNELDPPKIERLDYSDWLLWKTPSIKATAPQKKSLSFSESAEGILVMDFTEAFSRQDDFFQSVYKDSEFTNHNDLFSAFQLAFLTSGLFIYIPAGVQAKVPIETDFLGQKIVEEHLNHQVFIYAEKNSSVEIIEKYYAMSESQKQTSLNVHVHIHAQEGANVKYTAMDQLDPKTTAFFRRTGITKKDATLNIALAIMNDGNSIEDTQVDLMGEGSSGAVKSVAISHGQQIQSVNTNVTNHGAHTIGNIYQHGAVLDEATLTFNGVGHVLKNAKESDAQQELRILMLSDEARADANPILLIDEYELTAGHAASVSRVDEMQLYYLMSRGLGRKQAEKLVIRGFLGSVLSDIAVKDVREKLSETIERKLSTL